MGLKIDPRTASLFLLFSDFLVNLFLSSNSLSYVEYHCSVLSVGLIPSSRISWRTAVEALKATSGGFLHIHANVEVKYEQWIVNA